MIFATPVNRGEISGFRRGGVWVNRSQLFSPIWVNHKGIPWFRRPSQPFCCSKLVKKTRLVFLIGLALIGTVFLCPRAAHCIYYGSERPQPPLPEFAPDRLIIKLKAEADEKVSLRKAGRKVVTGLAAVDSLHHRFGVKKQEKLFGEFKETALKSDKFSSVYLLQVPDGTDLMMMKSAYEDRPEVEYAELDHRFQLFEAPNDPLFSHQWYLDNTAQGYLGVNRIAGHRNDTQVIK